MSAGLARVGALFAILRTIGEFPSRCRSLHRAALVIRLIRLWLVSKGVPSTSRVFSQHPVHPAQPSTPSTGTTAIIPTRSALLLWLYGCAMLVPVLYFVSCYPLLPNAGTLTDLGKLVHYKPGAFAAYVGAMATLFGLYILALHESRRLPTRRALPAVFGVGSALACSMIWMYPVNAVDVFLYAVRSRLWTTYGANPIAALPRDYPYDAWAGFAHQQWAKVGSPYGPLWNLVAAPITYLAGDQMLIALIGFKVLAVVCLLAGGWVIVRARAAAAQAPPATGALLYLWNPLVLWEGVANAHNDVLVALVLLLALLAWTKLWNGFVVPLIVVAALIKYVPLLLIPLATLALAKRVENWQERWRLLLVSIGLSTLAVLIALYPFYDLGAIRTSIAHQSSILRMSPPAVVIRWLGHYYPGEEVRRWVRFTGVGIVLTLVVWQGLAVWRRPRHLPRASYEVVYACLLVVIWNYTAWYLIWPAALAAVLPWGWPAWRMIAWTAGAMACYSLVIFIEAWWKPGPATIENVAVVLAFGATILLSLCEIIYRLLDRQSTASGSCRNLIGDRRGKV